MASPSLPTMGAMSPTALSRLFLALTALCAVLAGLVGVAGYGVVTAEPEHTVTLRYEDVERMPEGITPETVAAATGPGGVPSWRPIEMLVTGRHLRIVEQSGRAELPADVVLSTQDEEEEYDSVHITSEFRETAEVRSGAAVRPGLFDEDRLADQDSRWDTSRAYASNRDLGHGAHAVTAAARTAGELTYDGLPREPLLYAGIATALLTLGLIPLALWFRVRRRIDRLRRRLRSARTDLARVILDLEAVEVAVLTTPEGASGGSSGRSSAPDLRGGLARLTDSAFALARGEEDLARRLRRPDRGAEADLQGHESAVARVRGQAAGLHDAATLQSRHAGAQTAADRLVAPLVMAAQAVVSRVRRVSDGRSPEAPSDRPRSDAVADRLQSAAEALLQVAADAGSGDLTGLAPRVLEAEGELARASADLVQHLRAAAGPAGGPIDEAVTAVPSLRPDPEDAARRANAGLPAVGPADAPQALSTAYAAVLVAGAADPQDVVAAVVDADRELRGSVAPTPDEWRAAVARVAEERRRAGERERSASSGPWWAAVGTAVGCVVLAGLIARPLAEAATAEPGWDLTGSDEVASLVVDGLPQGVLTEEHLSVEDVRGYLEETLPAGLDVTVAVRPAASHLVPDPSGPSSESIMALDRSATLDGLARLKAEFPDLLEPGTGDLRPGAVIVPVFTTAGGQVIVDASLTGVVAYGTESWLEGGGFERMNVSRGWEPDLTEVSVAHEIEDVARGVQSEGAFESDVETSTLWALLTVSGGIVLLMLALAARAVGGAMARRFGVGPARGTVARARGRLERLMLDLDLQRLDAVAVLGRGPAADAREAEQRLWESALVSAWREADEIERLPLPQQWDEDVKRRAAALAARVEDLAAHRSDVAARAEL